MKFAHLVEINDPLNPLIDVLSREQLWNGLVLRAESPAEFIPWLDRCVISNRTDTAMSRVSQYGDVVVQDEVELIPLSRVIYRVPPQKDIPESSLTMTIEEPEPGILYLRFEYDDAGPEAGVDEMYNEFRRSAYEEADIDTVRVIRQMAEAGRLD
ncbi:DUF1857 family protein [Oxalobacteraceae bacterium OM1]|nr:DUF1857 family protein [Oxalobacteraceae bacterium OM1]